MICNPPLFIGRTFFSADFKSAWAPGGVFLTIQVELLFALSRTGVLFILLTSRQGIHQGRDPGFPSGHHPE